MNSWECWARYKASSSVRTVMSLATAKEQIETLQRQIETLEDERKTLRIYRAARRGASGNTAAPPQKFGSPDEWIHFHLW